MSILLDQAHQNILNTLAGTRRQVQKNQAADLERRDRRLKEELAEETLDLMETQVRLKRKNDALVAANQKLTEEQARARQLLVMALDHSEALRRTVVHLKSRWEPQDEHEKGYKEQVDPLIESKAAECASDPDWAADREAIIRHELAALAKEKKLKK